MRARTFILTATTIAIASLPGHALAAPGTLAPLPGTVPAETARASVPSAVERLSRGVVTVERGGVVVGVGSVLSGDGDGRILTALSPMGASEVADVRYADGSVVHAKIGHRDKAWDLALLVPLTGKWVGGLVASGANAGDVALQAPVALRPGRPVVVPARIRGVIDARAKEGNGVLASVLDVELQSPTPTAPSVGAPLTDSNGGVVGVFVRACQQTLPMVAAPGATVAPVPPPPCVPIVVAAPVSAIRDFLSRTPAGAVTPTAWLGIVGVPDAESNTHGVRVMAIAPDSPAQKGGLKASSERDKADLIVAVDGAPVDTPEHLSDIISRHAIGEHVKLLLITDGKFHEAVVVLRAAP